MAANKSVKFLTDLVKLFSSRTGYDSWFQKARIISGGNGKCVCEFTVDDEHLNRGGALHGGCIASLVDMVSTLALMTAPDTSPGVSVDLSISYLNAAKKGDDIIIDADTMKAGKTLAFLNVVISRKSDGKLIATGKHTKFTGANQSPGEAPPSSFKIVNPKL